jgi:ribokinase
MPASIAIVGSLNMDFVARVDQLPLAGQTVLGFGFGTIPGGKGANQACAAGRLGGRVRMIGRVGDDGFGSELRAGLQSAGVDVRDVRPTDGTPTGVALIFVDARGENQIVVAPGANAALTVSDIEQALGEAEPGGYLLLQLETPLETVNAAASLGKQRGLTVILDPAPAQPLPATLLASVDIITPNETEALILLGRREATVSLEEAPDVARALRELGVGTVIVKLGGKGAFLSTDACDTHFAAPRVDVVDATAAGDTFNGALGVALAEGRPIQEAIVFANRAAALSVTRAGAQASIPTREEFLAIESGGW